ncbi:MAG: ribose-phosphate pyrophosphokinase [Simkaniaceae bacterium]|nr:ribose-phosphate pyrophosphokinase [Simkaniaceae bacterium]
MSLDRAVVFSGTSHKDFAAEVASCLKVDLGKIDIHQFPDGEIGVQIIENVRGRDVFVIQSIARHPNFYLMELLIIVDALKRASAGSITAVIPYYGYCRQDRKDKGRVPITAKLVADMLQVAGVDRLLTMDLHAGQVQGFFDIPVDNLDARSLFIERIREMIPGCIVVAPDVGSIRIADLMARDLGTEFAIVDKRRISVGQVKVAALIGSVKGKDVVLIDDMYSTGATLKAASLACKEAGAKRIVAVVTHGLLLTDPFENSAIEKLLVTNTVPPKDQLERSKVEVVSAASLFGKAIESIVESASISSLFKK